MNRGKPYRLWLQHNKPTMTNTQCSDILLMCQSLLRTTIDDDLKLEFSEIGCSITHSGEVFLINERQAKALFDVVYKRLRWFNPKYNTSGLKKLTLAFNVNSPVSMEEERKTEEVTS